MSIHNICFLGEMKKNIMWIPTLICSYEFFQKTIQSFAKSFTQHAKHEREVKFCFVFLYMKKKFKHSSEIFTQHASCKRKGLWPDSEISKQEFADVFLINFPRRRILFGNLILSFH